MHVHLVGNGKSGSGCWLRPRLFHRLLARFMVRQIGLPAGLDSPDFDTEYGRLLVRNLAGSSLSHAVLLAHEEVYHEDGTRMRFGSFHVPNRYVLEFCRRNPAFLPGVSIHPARQDALDELDRCLEAGAVMLKLLPNCHNVDATREAYRPFWRRMAEAGLPLLAHTGGEHTVPQVRPALANPETLRIPLECGVTVIAAHCATRSGLFDPDWFDRLCAMMRDHPRLYADLSALNLPVRSSGFVRALREESIHDRLVHGSDFPVPVFPAWTAFRGAFSRATARSLSAIPNLLERDAQSKRAAGFPDAVFTRIWDLLRVTAA